MVAFRKQDASISLESKTRRGMRNRRAIWIGVMLCGCHTFRSAPDPCTAETTEYLAHSGIAWLSVDSAGMIVGAVLDAQSLKPVTGAALTINLGMEHAITDQAGRFRFTSIPAGSYQLTGRRIAYTIARDTIKLQEHRGVKALVILQPARMIVDECEMIAPVKR
jgi:hypothetical protein